MQNGYDFYFAADDRVLRLPITPGELKISVGSRNETIDLINQGEINILKSPSLIEVEFDACFPIHDYPFRKENTKYDVYFEFFERLKEKKLPFRFIISRSNPRLKTPKRWGTNLNVCLEEFEITESADDAGDVTINFKLKQYKPYGVKIAPWGLKPHPSYVGNRPTKKTKQTAYTVKNGDTLWALSKKFYGDATKWRKIYSNNKNAIEADARKHKRASSSNGHWIYPGLKLTIPK